LCFGGLLSPVQLSFGMREPFLVVIDKLIVFNHHDHEKMDRSKETHVLAGVRLLGTVRV